MADAIVVLNAGSSSIKFSLFALRDGGLEPELRGQIEGIYSAPRFVSKDEQGEVIAEKTWPPGTSLGHERALEHLISYLRGEVAQYRLVGIGHRVVHGGLAFREPVRLESAVLGVLEGFVPLMPLHQPHNLAPIRLLL